MTSLSFTPMLMHALAQRVDADAAQVVHERAVGVGEVEVVVEFLGGRLARHAVLELERADARLDLVRRGDRRRDCGGRLCGGQVWQRQHGAGDGSAAGSLNDCERRVMCMTSSLERLGLLEAASDCGAWICQPAFTDSKVRSACLAAVSLPSRLRRANAVERRKMLASSLLCCASTGSHGRFGARRNHCTIATCGTTRTKHSVNIA